ncbi:MAG: Ppx/GppA phosphatase family protein [Hyphomonadaceae bacterium]|nr:Ppx/GppA phosphatase family protein [Hyphomonadaceae bacterium]
MAHKEGAVRPGRRRRSAPPSGGPVFAALDLGTNNCRLLLAEPGPRGFRVIDSYSRIVRLGEGLARTGALSEAAMDRALQALQACAEKVAVQPRLRLRCIATQACRAAANGEAFLARVRRETGLCLEVVTPEEEARLSVLGCAPLMDPAAEVALVIDIGGGSTELSWVNPRSPQGAPEIFAWTSLPTGVVTLAERMPEAQWPGWYDAMREHAAAAVRAFRGADALAGAFRAGRAHIVGTSGAVSSLAGVHLALPRYQRSRVDGLWMTVDAVRTVTRRLLAMAPAERARHPCIGPDRGDLVVPGAAILEAVCDAWPARRVRVADRGLREGVLMELMARARHDRQEGQP